MNQTEVQNFFFPILGRENIQRMSQTDFQNLGEDEWDGGPKNHFQKLGGWKFNESPRFITKFKGRTNETEVQKIIFKIEGERKFNGGPKFIFKN